MTVLFRAKLSSNVSSVSSLFDKTAGQNVVKSGFLFILLDDRHRWNMVQGLLKEGSRPWTESSAVGIS